MYDHGVLYNHLCPVLLFIVILKYYIIYNTLFKCIYINTIYYNILLSIISYVTIIFIVRLHCHTIRCGLRFYVRSPASHISISDISILCNQFNQVLQSSESDQRSVSFSSYQRPQLVVNFNC